jgi:hypothetical protein
MSSPSLAQSLPDDVLVDILFNLQGLSFPPDEAFPLFLGSRQYVTPSYFKSLHACLLTCKQWSLAAVTVLYHTIQIMDHHMLNCLVDNLESPTAFYDYAHYIRKLD